MNSDAILILKYEILELADVFAEAVVKRTHPVEDELTQRQARKEFGAVWLKHHEERGRVKGHRKGMHGNSPIVYSRVDLMALKEAERRGVQMVRKHKKQPI